MAKKKKKHKLKDIALVISIAANAISIVKMIYEMLFQ